MNNLTTMHLDLDDYAVIVLPKDVMKAWWDVLDGAEQWQHFFARSLVVAQLLAQDITPKVKPSYMKNGVIYRYSAEIIPDKGFQFTVFIDK